VRRPLADLAVASANKIQFSGARKFRTYIDASSAIDLLVDRIRGSFDMKKLSIVCVALCVSFSTTAAFARGGGMGSHSMSMMGGGAFGTSAAAPGTNSLGTALSSSGTGNGAMKGPLLGTSPSIDREEAKVDKMIDGICRGC
jgi:hypothetical protein